tara:strand:+ start:56831 stop:63742 length:6912 start_codon:yes stop_codon:yes gene_type:complete
MAKIFDVSAYPTITPAGSDLIIGTDVNDNNRTVTFKISDIVGGGGVAQDLTSVLSIGNSAANNLTLTGTGILTAVDVFPTVISAGTQGSHGAAGQVLTSTGTGIAWDTISGGSQTWDEVVTLGNTVSSQNLNLQDGSFSITQPGNVAGSLSGDTLTSLNWAGPINVGGSLNVNVGDFNLVNSTALKISQTTGISIDDGNTIPPVAPVYSKGSAGQALVSTGSGVKWSSGPTNTPHTLQQVLTQGNTATDVGVSFLGTSTSTFGDAVTFDFGGFVNITGDADTGVPTTKGILKITNGALDIAGDYSELRLKGSAGTAGQVLLSQGTTATPIWSNAQIAPTLQNVLDNSAGTAATGTNAIVAVTGNAAVGLSPTEGIIQAQNGAFNLWGDFSEFQLKGSAGTAGQVLISQGIGATPVWGTNGGGGGSGTLTGIGSVNTNYVNTGIDNTVPANPVITSSLVTNNLVQGGPVSLINDTPSVIGTGYNTNGVFDTVAISPSTGTGLKVQITVDGLGGVDEIVAITNPGIGYQQGDTYTITSGNNDAVSSVVAVVSGTYYGQTGGFTVPAGNDWDLSFVATGSVSTTTILNSGAGYPINNTSTNTPTTVTPAGGSGATFDIQTGPSGTINSMTLNAAGSGYSVGDVLSIITGVPPTTPRTLEITSVNSNTITLKNTDAVRTSSVNIDKGSGITLNLDNNNDLTISSNASGGTVTSVGLTSTNSTIGISGSPITSSGDIDIDLPTQTAYSSGTFSNASVTVDDYGIITNITAGTDSPYTLTANAAGTTSTVTNPAGGAGYTATGTVGTQVTSGSGNNDLTVSYTNTGGAIDLNGITVVAAGTGYAVGDTFTVNGGTPGSLVTGTVTVITPTEADISLVNASAVRDTIKIVEGANISITDSGADSITIAATAAAGITSFGLATNPASFTGTVDVTNNTITFVEKVDTIAGAPAVNKSYISLDLSDPLSTFNELTVGLSADTSSLDTTTMLTHYLRADNTWGVPSVAGTVVDSLNTLTGALTLEGSGQSDIGTGGVATFSINAGVPSLYQTMNNVGYPVTFSTTTNSATGSGCMITATNTAGVLSNLSVYSAGKGYQVNDTIDIEEALGYPALSTRVSLNVDTITAAGAIQSFTKPYTNSDLRTKVIETGSPVPSNADPKLQIVFETPQKYDFTETTFTGSTGIDVDRVSDTEIKFTNTAPQTNYGATAPINLDGLNNFELIYTGGDNVVTKANNLVQFNNAVNLTAKGYLQNTDKVLVNDRVQYALSIATPGAFPPNQQYNNVPTTVSPAGGTGLTISFLTDNNGQIVATNNSIEVTNDGSGYNSSDVLQIAAASLTPAGTVDAFLNITSVTADKASYIEISQLADAVNTTSSWALNGDTGTANITDNSIVSLLGGDGLNVTVVAGTTNTATITGSVFTLGDGLTTNGVQGFVPGPLIADFGTNKFLKVNGTWALPVTSINTLTDGIELVGSGDITLGVSGVASVVTVLTNQGSGYALNGIYATTVAPSGGTGLTLKVTAVGAAGEAQQVSVYSAGQGYTANDVVTLIGQSSSGTANTTVFTLTADNTIVVSTTESADVYDIKMSESSLGVATDPNLTLTRTNINGSAIVADNIQVLGETGIKVARNSDNAVTISAMIDGSGDITIGESGVESLTGVIAGGTGYVVNKIYSTTSSISGAGATIKVTGVNGNVVTTGVIYSKGRGYAIGETLTLIGLGSGNNATFDVNTITDENRIQISNVQDLEDGVTSVNSLEGDIDIKSSGDIIIGINGVETLNNATLSGGTGYVADRTYRTTGGGGTGLTVLVTGVTVGGVPSAVSVFAKGQGYTSGAVTLIGQGSDGGCTINISTLTSANDIQVSSSLTDLSQFTNSPGYTAISGGTQYFLAKFNQLGTTVENSNFIDRPTGLKELQGIGPNATTNEHYQLLISGTGYIGLTTTAASNTVRLGSGYLGTENDGTAVDSVYVGYNSGESITDGYSNTFIGKGAGADITTGFETTYIGKSAGAGTNNTNSRRSVAIGALAAQNAYGDGDVFIGRSAGNGNTNVTASPGTAQLMERVAIGLNAMSGLVSGTTVLQGNNRYSVAIGAFAGNAPGSTATGPLVGFRTHIGYKAGANEQGQTNPADNSGQIAIGTYAMWNHTSFKRGAIAIGEKAYTDTINAAPVIQSSWDVSIGAYSFGANGSFYPEITGEGNIAIGYLAGTDSTQATSMAGGTIAIGKRSRALNIDTIAIGADAAAGGNNIDNAIAIGKSAIAAVQNSLVIGKGAEASGAGIYIGSSSNPIGNVVNSSAGTLLNYLPITIDGTAYKIPLGT